MTIEGTDMDPVLSSFIDRLRDAFHHGDPGAAGKAAESNNVARLQDQYRALAKADIPAFAALLSDDIEMEILGANELPFVRRARGRDAVLDAVARNFALVEQQQPEVEQVVAQGDTVVVVARERGRVKATGRDYDIRWVQMLTFRDGLLCRFREMADADSLVAATRAQS
jgi:ketosteroid isomerase-like protein